MDLSDLPRAIELRSFTEPLFLEVLNFHKKREKIKKDLTLDLNAEGAEAFQTRDPLSLAIHLNNYASILSMIGYINQKKPFRLLELGCGSALFSQAFLSFVGEASLLCGDYNHELIEFARKTVIQKRPIDFQTVDVLSIPATIIKNVDTVFFCELWEHLSEKEATKVLKSLHQNLSDGAFVLFSTPDVTPFKKKKTHYYAHKREYTFKSLCDFFSDSSKNPFTKFEVYKVINKDLVKDLTFINDNFGYYLNFLYKNVRQIALANDILERVHTSAIRGWYAFVRRLRSPNLEKKINKKYCDSLLANTALENAPSFSLVAVFQK